MWENALFWLMVSVARGSKVEQAPSVGYMFQSTLVNGGNMDV